MISAIHSALQGMQTGRSIFIASAGAIARTGTSSKSIQEKAGGLEQAMVGLKSGQYLYEANLQVARTADEMLGSLVDILA